MTFDVRTENESGNATGFGPGFGYWQVFSVLVVDDEEGMRNFLSRTLKPRCALVESVGDVENATQLMARLHFDLIVLDIALPGKSGIEWLCELREGGFVGDIILMTAFADMETAINALRGGASDFILKPFRVDQMLNSINRCFERARLARENFVLRRELVKFGAEPGAEVDGLVGSSAAIQNLRSLIKRIAPMPTTVLLQGESGTGKEVTARALHQMSPRAARPFVPLNCGAIAAELIESELFGHVKGAFTGASSSRNGLFYYAHGGTLFLDEIGELPLPMQIKLLRVLEERKVRPVGSEKEVPVDVRIIAATNRDLAGEVAAGRFRRDLYFRLAVVEISIPALRSRHEDIGELVDHFMASLSLQLGVSPLPFGRALLSALMSYHWPGNVRELKNFVERSLILGCFPVEALATACGMPGDASRVLPPGAYAVKNGSDPANEELLLSLDEVEKQHILRVLDSVGGNKSEAARRLGVSRKTLERKCLEWGVWGVCNDA